MHFAIQCTLAKNTDEKRLALRATHLRYIEANKERIFCGDPTVNLEGQPEMMLITYYLLLITYYSPTWECILLL